MAFLIAFICYIINSNSISNLIIRGYILNTTSIEINPLGLAVLLIALNAIYSIIFLLILGILIVII